MGKVVILLGVLLVIPILVLGCYIARQLPPEVRTETGSSGDDGEAVVSETATTSTLTLVLVPFFMGCVVLALFVGVFKSMTKFATGPFPGILWVVGTPGIFLAYFCNYLFERLPCPQCHKLEGPIMFFGGAVFLSYAINYCLLVIELFLKVLELKVPKFKLVRVKEGPN